MELNKLGIEAREIFRVGQSLREICPLKIKKKKNAQGLKDKFSFLVLTTPRLEDIPNFLRLNERTLFPVSAIDLCIYFTDGEIRML